MARNFNPVDCYGFVFNKVTKNLSDFRGGAVFSFPSERIPLSVNEVEETLAVPLK